MNDKGCESFERAKSLAGSLLEMFEKEKIPMATAVSAMKILICEQAIAHGVTPERFDELLKKESVAYKAVFELYSYVQKAKQ